MFVVLFVFPEALCLSGHPNFLHCQDPGEIAICFGKRFTKNLLFWGPDFGGFVQNLKLFGDLRDPTDIIWCDSYTVAGLS